ncbi:MAG: DNA recombination protein RmuC [Muribaculaceae bacterium]|nr:DNA recombination protein RmuC [Muribaculaceae bacterium]
MDTLTAILIIICFVTVTVLIYVVLNHRSRMALENARRQYQEELDLLERRINEQSQEMAQKLVQQSRLEFQALADDILTTREERLNRENERQINTLLTPLNSNIENFKKAIDSYYMAENRDKGIISNQLKDLILSNRVIADEARRLSAALSGNTRVQGKWGETILENMLVKAGMIKGVNYLTQVNKDSNGVIRDEDDRSQKPDMVVLLPEGQKIIIDAKVSLTYYLQYTDCENNETAEAMLKRHAESVRKHVDELARKQYHKNIEGAMEHTLMFIPNDMAYISAVSHTPDLWDYAYSRNVVIVSGTHLLSVLQIIKQLWRVENQNRNAEEIARLGGLIFDKLVTFMNDFTDIQRHIDATSKAYEKCVSHIEHSSVGLKARATKLRDLGSKTTKTIR